MIELVDTPNAPEIFFDGVEEVRTQRGVARFAMFVRGQNGSGIVVGRVSIPISGLPDVIQALVICLSEAAQNGLAQ